MAKNENKQKYFGLLASIDWNSNKWQDLSTQDDLKHSNFGFVKEHNITYTCLNFAHNKYPVNKDGYYQGLLPQLWSKSLDKEKSKFVEIVFIKSHNWHDKQNYIIGLYAFPQFQKGKKPSPIASFSIDFEVNLKALPEDIHLLENYINLKTSPDIKKFLPIDKELGKQGYNYLTKENVYKILDTMSNLNPVDKKFSGIKRKLITSIDKKN